MSFSTSYICKLFLINNTSYICAHHLQESTHFSGGVSYAEVYPPSPSAFRKGAGGRDFLQRIRLPRQTLTPRNAPSPDRNDPAEAAIRRDSLLGTAQKHEAQRACAEAPPHASSALPWAQCPSIHRLNRENPLPAKDSPWQCSYRSAQTSAPGIPHDKL